jgi:LCP family protein required for cell wall assembly
MTDQWGSGPPYGADDAGSSGAPRRGGDRGGNRTRPKRPPGTRPGRWRRTSTLAKIGYISATVCTVIVVVIALGAYAVYAHLNGNIHTVKVSGLTHRSVYGVQNILVLGSQTRDGQGPGFGYDPGTNLSDNLILVHLDPTHTHATVLSIPRDLMVYEPACKARPGVGTGTWPAEQLAQIDGAMNLGGPSCAVRTVEDLTGIKMDHFVEFNFNSFRAMVDAIGGVEVCVPPGGYHDPWSHLHLSAGKHLVTYNQALAYVRDRHGVTNGGDLGRIQLQQAFISSLIQKVNSQGLLANLSELYRVADVATRSLRVDQGLGSVSKLLHLADSLRDLHAKNVNLITLPTLPWPPNINRLEVQQPQDDVILQMIKTGKRWHGHLPKLPPGQVKVRVLNGTGIPGLAGRTARRLRKLGFDVLRTGNAPATAATTVEYSGYARADSAYTLMTALDAFPAAQDLIQPPAPPTGVSGPVTLILGADFAGVKAPRAARRSRSRPTGSQPDIETRNAAASICSGLPPQNPDPGTPP